MSLDLTLYQLDAFAEAPFAGNPAAVVPLDAWLADATLQAIAAENNLSETAFFVPTPEDAESDFHLRWFTPSVEVDLCGHATLASGAVLFDRLDFDGGRIRFATRSGVMAVERGEGGRFALDFPQHRPAPVEPPETLARALGGSEPLAFLRARMNLAILPDEASVRALVPDLAAIAAMPGDRLVVSAPGDGCDAASRYFAPHAGIDEDPVTGSAHCMIAPYWGERLGKSMLHCRQVSPRGGDLYCTLAGDRVRIEGHVRPYLEGRIAV